MPIAFISRKLSSTPSRPGPAENRRRSGRGASGFSRGNGRRVGLIWFWSVFAMVSGWTLVLLLGERRWREATRSLQDGLDVSRQSGAAARIDPEEWKGLPPPVQRYLEAALGKTRRRVAEVGLTHTGTFNMSETGENWRPFVSEQRIVAHRPGFLWEARISMLPGLGVRVHDAYVAGEGRLQASMFGLVDVVDLSGTADLAAGELMRLLAEAAWVPTVLLPGQGVTWEAVDGNAARAVMRDGDVRVDLLFRFREDGLIASVFSEARGRTVGGKTVPTPWEGRWSRYENRHGMLIPIEGEVAWLTPEGRRPYWRGTLKSIEYRFSE